ncbi:LemA family protein, partial [Candidatus Bipolaricaulota bacterium]|nr:LemA family protein [Candidatus Bipolaricaulota bacterium]
MGIIIVVVGFVLLWGGLAYNRLVRLRVRAEAAWRDIDTQLKRRWDLIPNVVETVKGYAAHESGVFESVTLARTRAIDAAGPQQQAVAEEGLKGAMKSLFAVVESYPELKANESFLQMQQTLEQVEDAIQRSRRYYNAVVRDLNTSIQTFPRNILASLFRFEERE